MIPAFHCRIIVTVAFLAHATNQLVLLKDFLISGRTTLYKSVDGCTESFYCLKTYNRYAGFISVF
jgi:hypothetical protein